MPISVNNKEIVAINCEGREIVRAHVGLSLVFSKQQDLYGGMDISSIADLVMFRDLINTGTCIWKGQITNTYKGNPIATGGLGATWYVTADIDMSAVCSPSLGSWVPIGTSSRPFAGTIEGLNFTISNLYISTTTQSQGLFGYVRGTTLRNLTVSGSVSCAGYSAILAGRISYNTTSYINVFENITTAGSITFSAGYGGGVVGYSISSYNFSQPSVSFINCINNAVITNGASGGICGYISSSYQPVVVSGCINNGNITSIGAAAGIVCVLSATGGGTINNNINNATITTSSSAAGGVFYQASGTNITYEDLTNYGDVIATVSASSGDFAGVAALMYGNSLRCSNYGSITGFIRVGGCFARGSNDKTHSECYNEGDIYQVGTTTNGYYGGILANAGNNNKFYTCENKGNIQLSTANGVGGIVGGIGSSSSLIEFYNCVNRGSLSNSGATAGRTVGGIRGTSDTYFGNGTVIHDCINYGTITGNYCAGILAGTGNIDALRCKNYGSVNGTTTASGIGYNEGGLPHICTFTDCENYGNVSATTSAGICAQKGSSTTSVFTFTNCINDYTFSGSNGQTYGIGVWGVFINCINYKSISNLIAFGVAGTMLAGSTNCVNWANILGANAGGVAQQAQGDQHINHGNVDATNVAGGIAQTVNGDLTNCINYGAVSAGSTYNVGGIAAGSGGYTVSYCKNYGTVTHIGTNQLYCGGIVGSTSGTITKCENFAVVSGSRRIGGIAGQTKAASIVSNCINHADVYGGGESTGGIVGYHGDSESIAVVRNCLNKGNVINTAASPVYVGGIVGYGYRALIDTNLNVGYISLNGTTSSVGSVLGFDFLMNGITSNFYDATVETVYKAFQSLADRAGEGEGRPTSNLLGNSLLGAGSGWTTDNWVFTAGDYPTPRMD